MIVTTTLAATRDSNVTDIATGNVALQLRLPYICAYRHDAAAPDDHFGPPLSFVSLQLRVRRFQTSAMRSG